ncbi:mitochondrial 54S ribosomal mL60 domain-containing protein [Aspergillus tanneri]|uniref:54S ribosomal protein L31, mitochondrial n=1 Tax=Aspergillus tanneri TaxID=1220188 RepID=A0A5M9MAX2_9EURO|nr:uncharacterized protein ATNIH1004_008255 [Aspergillus tanneri]KAA8644058.1 hypothetical protein ATNIH1004_008255 [Aspergillus tanneri]
MYRNERHKAATPNIVVADIALQGTEGESPVAPESIAQDVGRERSPVREERKGKHRRERSRGGDWPQPLGILAAEVHGPCDFDGIFLLTELDSDPSTVDSFDLSVTSVCEDDVQAFVTPLLGSSLIPWRISSPQKARQRKRLRAVDNVVDTVSAALQRNGVTAKAVDRWYREMPREQEMLPKDKYTIFDKKEKKYRKGIHKLPKWTRVSQRVNPPGF